jgi:7-carboxy-7-deazaguanine synthase
MRLPVTHPEHTQTQTKAENALRERKYVKWIGEPPAQGNISLVETFVSIQGEGNMTGFRSMFIRTSQCNLRCTWCDTKYSFNPAAGAHHGTEQGHYELSVEEIVKEAVESKITHAVLTGGEPMLQPYLPELINSLSAQGIHITVESNGTIPITDAHKAVDLWSIAPKMFASSKMTYDAKAMKALLNRWDELHSGFQLKFICDSDEDLDEAFDLIHQLALNRGAGKMPNCYFHPNGMVDDEYYGHACKEIAEKVLERLQVDSEYARFVKVGLQTHRLMWGHTLGT